MAQLKKVMKAPNEIFPFDHAVIRYPQLASVKYDGFRCLNLCGERLLSPALKDIPNRQIPLHLNNFIEYCKLNRIVTDGELWSPTMSFSELSSVIRSHNKPMPSDLRYYIFDAMSEYQWDMGNAQEFHKRVMFYMRMPPFANVVKVPQINVTDPAMASDMFTGIISADGEGVILRSPNATYKHGRCTPNEDGMWKFKQFETHDAVILALEEQQQLKPGVERTVNAIGELEREHSQDLYEPAGMVGAFLVSWREATFRVKPGKGCDHFWKRKVWQEYCADTSAYIGKTCEFKFMPHGTKDKPRIGSFIRMRLDK